MLSTKNINLETGGSSSKTLLPGNLTAKINAITLEDLEMKEGASFMMLHLEGQPVGGDFEGFFIDKDRPELGRALGKTSRVRHHQYAYVDTETRKGMIYKNDEILRAVKQICIATDSIAWLDSQDEKHATIESLIDQMNIDAPYKDKWLDFCIAAREYMNKNGYIDHSLYLPRFVKKSVPYEKHGLNSGNLIQYDESLHLKKVESKPVESFGEDTDPVQDTPAELPSAKKGKKPAMKDFEL